MIDILDVSEEPLIPREEDVRRRVVQFEPQVPVNQTKKSTPAGVAVLFIL